MSLAVGSPTGLADMAEQVLREASGGPLHYREITERATNAGLMMPTGETPWASVNAAMGVDNRRREARGELPRFVGAGGGFYRLRTAATEVEQAIERWNDSTKKELLVQLGEIDPGTFEELIGELLERIGFEDVEVTKRSGDGGIDVRGVLTVGGVTRRYAFKVAPDRGADIQGRRVVLIDDVLTSGATVDACARALLRAKAASVDVLVFARVVDTHKAPI